ncbi:MAG: HAMP domain-containing sensor histidine kinase [Thermoleophilia bacterium]
MSLRTRLLLALLGLVAAGLLVAGAATYSSLRSFLVDRVDQQLREALQPAAIALGGGPGVGGPGGSNLPPGTYAQLRDGAGTVLNTVSFTYGAGDYPAPVLPDPLPSGSAGSRDDDGRGAVFTAESTAGGAGGFRVLVERPPSLQRTLIVAIPLTETHQTLTRLLGIEALVSGLVLVGLAVAAWLLIKRDLRPLESMAVTADAIAAGDLSQRVEPAEPRTEVGRLGLSLNTMLARIEEAFAERAATEEKLRRFLADASHELRTPLTSIRGYAELFHRGAKDDPDDLATAMRRIEEEGRRMGVMVDELLLLARLGEGRRPERAPVDLARVVADAVGDARAADPSRPIALEAPAELLVTGDDLQLRQVVANLFGNARQHTPAGSPVRVRLRAEAEGPGGAGAAVLEVADEGPGLAPEAAGKVFEPFYRADGSRARQSGGAGLGLAIVAAIVEAHGGSVALRTQAGDGATFSVRLPLAAAADDA